MPRMSPAIGSVLCALDQSPIAPRVFRHAVGVAAVLGARLCVLTVSHRESGSREAASAAWLRDAVSAASAHVGDISVRVVRLAMGQPVDVILGAAEEGVDLIVAGTHGKSGLSRWFLGSTTAALLAETRWPTVLVPPGEVEIVTLDGPRAQLRPGAVLVAVDLDEHNDDQLAFASLLAGKAECPLVAMTVAAPGVAEDAAEHALAARLREAGPVVASRLLIRHGPVAREIDRAAHDVHAGLVVMGLRERGDPGEVATAVLTGKDAIVLAVPSPSRASKA
jgi:nucleotide-binding universal stress UspA family protein